jgi:pimeloyl-ACP methyl ester carboxylesterase
MKMNQLSRIYSVVAASVGYGMAILYPVSAFSQDNRFDQGVKNIVLVHRAWANGSSWSKVIPLLAEKGLHVTAVALPLTSLGDDVAATERALALETGLVLLVGHSYGGAVITEAGNQANVAGLLYVALMRRTMANPHCHSRLRILHLWVVSYERFSCEVWHS